MPADIRSFFGGGPKPTKASEPAEEIDEPKAKKAPPKKKGRNTRVIDDSDDEDQIEQPA